MIEHALEEEGALLRVTLAAPKANILDMATLDALSEVLQHAAERPETRAILLDHQGPHFSFGAAVEEHLPAQAEAMLHSFGRTIRAVVHSPIPVIAAVNGRCLGGATELVCAAHVLVANEDALLGQPEIMLGVFPPAAIALTAWRAPVLQRLVLTGETMGARRLAELGLVTEVCEGPAQAAALAFFRNHLAPRSAFALRELTRAMDPGDAFDLALYNAEQSYLQRLMNGHDPVEGLQAFLDRRKPAWEHR